MRRRDRDKRPGRARLAALLPVLAVLALASPGRAAFEELPGLRAGALGGAGTATGGDPLGLFLNPASVAWGFASRFEAYTARPFTGLEGDDLARNALGGFSSLGDWGGLGLGYDRFSSRLYREQATMLAYARRLPTRFGEIAAGAGVSLLGRSYEQTVYTAVDPLFLESGFTKRSVAVDAGVQWRPDPRLSFGLALRRLNRPNQALGEGAVDPLPRQVAFGAAARWRNYGLFTDLEFRDRALNGLDWTPRIGLEAGLLEGRLALRAGGNRDEVTAGFALQVLARSSSGSYVRPTAAGSAERVHETKELLLRAGYTFRYPIGGLASTTGTHQLGLTVFFDRLREVVETRTSTRPDIRERVLVKTDTVFVPSTEYIRVQELDSALVKSYEDRIRELQEQLQIQRSFNQAIGHLEKALRYYFQKEYPKALEECDSALDLVPRLALAHIRKGSIFFAMGRYDDARREWKLGLQYDPGNKEVAEFLRLLDQAHPPKR